MTLRKSSLNPKITLGSSRPPFSRLESRGEVEKFTTQEEVGGEVGGLMSSMNFVDDVTTDIHSEVYPKIRREIECGSFW